MVTFYRRRLPHLFQAGQPVFITWRLHGSLPSNRPFSAECVSSGRAFAVMDRLLDHARTGPADLGQPALAQMVVEAIRYHEQVLQRYSLHAFAVLRNHVHLLLTPHVDLPELTKSLKGFTARRANALLARTGAPFWQEESYDHLIRSQAEFERVRSYIEWNPVRAGLVANPPDYPWSSASPCAAVGRAATPARDGHVPPSQADLAVGRGAGAPPHRVRWCGPPMARC